jgi:hypothetical protein
VSHLSPAFRGEACSPSCWSCVTALVRESLRAARDAGRTIEEVWAEALGDWLTTQHESFEPTLVQHLGRIYKRQRVWGEIDETLHELRAS